MTQPQLTTAVIDHAPPSPMLDVSGLNFYYGESHILRNIDLGVASGQNGLSDWP